MSMTKLGIYFFFFLMTRRPPISPLFPYTTLSRSGLRAVRQAHRHRLVLVRPPRRLGEEPGPPAGPEAHHGLGAGLGRTDRAAGGGRDEGPVRSEEHTSELQSQSNLVCRLLLEKKK